MGKRYGRRPSDIVFAGEASVMEAQLFDILCFSVAVKREAREAEIQRRRLQSMGRRR